MSPADDRPGNMSPSAYLSTLAPKLLRLQSLRQQPFAPRAGDLYMRWEPSQTAGLQNLQRLVSNWKGAQLKQELGNVLYQLHLVSSLPLTMSMCQSRLVKSVEWSHFGVQHTVVSPKASALRCVGNQCVVNGHDHDDEGTLFHHNCKPQLAFFWGTAGTHCMVLLRFSPSDPTVFSWTLLCRSTSTSTPFAAICGGRWRLWATGCRCTQAPAWC